MSEHQPLISVITPVFNEKQSLGALGKRLYAALEAVTNDWEWILVDDHSSDGSFQLITELAQQDPRIRGVRLARNFGSHMAFTCGLDQASGDCAVVLAADLQDPPESINELVEKWRAGAQIVWAVRKDREGETAQTAGFSRLYYWIMRRFVGIQDIPATGADFFLLDRQVLHTLQQFNEKNVSILMLLTWMGYRQESIYYSKHARQQGTSGWTLAKKAKLLVDSITSFTFRPIRLMSYIGLGVALLGFLYAIVVVINSLTGAQPVQGWSSMMVVILILGGLQMTMMGILGEYLWRALDESRGRPRYWIESVVAERAAESLPEDST